MGRAKKTEDATVEETVAPKIDSKLNKDGFVKGAIVSEKDYRLHIAKQRQSK